MRFDVALSTAYQFRDQPALLTDEEKIASAGPKYLHILISNMKYYINFKVLRKYTFMKYPVLSMLRNFYKYSHIYL